MAAPLRREPPGYIRCTAVGQGIADAYQSAFRFDVDAVAAHDDQSVPTAVELLPAVDVGHQLSRSSRAGDRGTPRRAAGPRSGPIWRSRSPRVRDRSTMTVGSGRPARTRSRRRRVSIGESTPSRTRHAGAELAAPAARRLRCRGDESLDRRCLRLDQTVPDDHEFHQGQPCRREVQEGLLRGGDGQTVPRRGGRSPPAVVGLDALPDRATARRLLPDMDRRGGRGQGSPNRRGGVMADAGSRRRDVERRLSAEPQVDRYTGADVLVVEHLLELPPEEDSDWQPGRPRRGPAVQLRRLRSAHSSDPAPFSAEPGSPWRPICGYLTSGISFRARPSVVRCPSQAPGRQTGATNSACRPA